MQDRIGANRASIYRLPDHRPVPSDRGCAEAAHQGRLHAGSRRPAASSWRRSLSVFLRPGGLRRHSVRRRPGRGDRVIPLQAVTLNVGILYLFAMLSLGVYGVMMAGWSSANNFALLGAQRAAALMISSEMPSAPRSWAW